MWQTFDSGNTWSGPTLVSQDATKTHWNPWMDYSPGGVLGLVWRTHEGAPFPALAPYSIWAATSDDGGQTFDVLKVNAGSPPAKAAAFLGLSGNIGQDRSAIALGDQGQRVYVALGRLADGRTEHLLQRDQIPDLRSPVALGGAAPGGPSTARPVLAGLDRELRSFAARAGTQATWRGTSDTWRSCSSHRFVAYS